MTYKLTIDGIKCYMIALSLGLKQIEFPLASTVQDVIRQRYPSINVDVHKRDFSYILRFANLEEYVEFKLTYLD